LVVDWLIVWEGGRQLTLDLLLVITLCKMVTHCLKIIKKIPNVDQAHEAYKQLQLICDAHEIATGRAAFLAVFCGQVGTVALFSVTWLVLKSGLKSPFHLIFPVFSVIAMVITLLVLPPALAIFETSNGILSNWKVGVFIRIKNENGIVLQFKKALGSNARALRHVRMTVGGITVVKKGYENEYLSVLRYNLMTALFMF